MTDAELAADTVAAQRLEARARAAWDALAQTPEHGTEYKTAMAAVRAAGALRQALHEWVLARALRGYDNAAETR